MPHAALDVGFHSHPKTLRAGNAATGLFARALSYCADHLTDGFVPAAWVAANGKPAEAQKLVDVELWTREGDGYRIVDYLVYNLSKAKVEEKSKRGKELADARWSKRDAMRSALPNAEHTAMREDAFPQCPSPSPTPRPIPTPGFEASLKEASDLDLGEVDGKEAVVQRLLEEIRDRDEVSDKFILSLARRAPEGAFIHTLEALERRRKKPGDPLVSESKYARATLANYIENGGPPAAVGERQYVRAASGTDDDIPF